MALIRDVWVGTWEGPEDWPREEDTEQPLSMLKWEGTDVSPGWMDPLTVHLSDVVSTSGSPGSSGSFDSARVATQRSRRYTRPKRSERSDEVTKRLRYERRRASNRLAAQRHRARRGDQVSTMKHRLKELEAENRWLREQVSLLKFACTCTPCE